MRTVRRCEERATVPLDAADRTKLTRDRHALPKPDLLTPPICSFSSGVTIGRLYPPGGVEPPEPLLSKGNHRVGFRVPDLTPRGLFYVPLGLS